MKQNKNKANQDYDVSEQFLTQLHLLRAGGLKVKGMKFYHNFKDAIIKLNTLKKSSTELIHRINNRHTVYKLFEVYNATTFKLPYMRYSRVE